MSTDAPLRVLIVDEGVLGHRTVRQRLAHALGEEPDVEVRVASVPEPSRLGRFLVRRWRGSGDIDMLMLRWRLRWSWHVRRLLKRNAGWADVALVITQAAALLSRGPMRRLPCVLMVDATVRQFVELEYLGPRDRWSATQERMVARLERRAIAGAAGVVALTEWNAEALRREYDLTGTRLVTIHPGLEADAWAASAAQRRERSDGPLRILFVGNEVKRKGLGQLIEALGLLDFDAVLDVVSGDHIPEGEAIRVHRDVSPGSERLRELFATADVFAFPTRADAVPWVVLEAMAAGLPVVATRVGAIEELVGDAGELIERDGVEELAGALRRLTDPDLRQRLGERAIERVRLSYDSAVQVPRLLELLREVASGSPAEASGGRISRRAFIAIGLGAAGAALIAPYAVLLPDDEFEQLVAARLGIESSFASDLLARARAEYGDAEYDARAAAFAFAVRDPAALLLPDSIRERAINGLVAPMLSAPAANLAYGITGSDPGSPACTGLVRG